MQGRDYHRFFYFTVLALIGLLYWPRIADYGLFMDGSYYGTIAHNMALGDGSFWRPIFHNINLRYNSGSAVFYEHPPLMFWLESWFFRVFGDGFYVENIYGTVILVLHILTLTYFFRALTQGKYSFFAAWPVLLLWYAVPTISWSFPQNMIDNTLSLWCLWAVYLIFIGLRKDHFLYAVVAGVLIGLAVLTKGPVGLFPLAAVGMYWLASLLTQAKGFRYPIFRSIYKTIALLFGLGIVGVNVYMSPSGRKFMTQYIHQQVIPSVSGQREMPNTLSAHLSILRDMLVEYAPIYGIAIVLWVIFRKRHGSDSLIVAARKNNTRFAVWMLMVGFSSTLPIALSAKSHSFYLISGVPYFAMAVVLYWVNDIDAVVQRLVLTKRQQSVWVGSVIAIFVFSIVSTVWQWGDYKRDTLLLHDMELLSQKMPKDTVVGIFADISNSTWYTFDSNLERHLLIRTNPDWSAEEVVLTRAVVDSTALSELTQNNYKPLEGDWKAFRVFVRK